MFCNSSRKKLHSNIKKSDRSLLSDVARAAKRKVEPEKSEKPPKAAKLTPAGKVKTTASPAAKGKAKGKAKAKS